MNMNRSVFVLAASVCVGASGCQATSPVDSHTAASKDVGVVAANQGVQVTNNSATDMRFSLIGRTTFHTALAQWCFGSPSCGTSLAPHATITVPYSQIPGADSPETEAMLMSWVPKGTDISPFDSLVVRIR